MHPCIAAFVYICHHHKGPCQYLETFLIITEHEISKCGCQGLTFPLESSIREFRFYFLFINVFLLYITYLKGKIFYYYCYDYMQSLHKNI